MQVQASLVAQCLTTQVQASLVAQCLHRFMFPQFHMHIHRFKLPTLVAKCLVTQVQVSVVLYCLHRFKVPSRIMAIYFHVPRRSCIVST
jgi:hypothetical protein